MSRAFDSAFNIIKASHFQATYGPEFFLKAIGGPEVEAMRSYVQMNESHPHPEVQQSVEDVYEHLTALASGQETPKPRMFSMQELSEMRQSGGPMSTEDPQGTVDARATPMQKAFRALLDAHFLRKNVVGMQDGIEYSQPPSISSMAQRPQIPETMMQTMQTQAPGMFGRFKQPVTRTAQIPTGQMSLGGPRTMNVQQNAQNPLEGFGAGVQNALSSGMGEMMSPPGAEVTRMPHPSPFGDGYGRDYGGNEFMPGTSFAVQGYQNVNGELVPPPHPYEGARGWHSHQNRLRYDEKMSKPVGDESKYAGTMDNTQQMAQAGDQFNRQTRQF